MEEKFININITSVDYDNLLAFLDRVEIKGLKEFRAFQLIIDALIVGKEKFDNKGRE
jgi:MoaA/NifB/PqqE/SkfB family radical SAM enzyme